jgi:predicted NACHT family NTPase
MDIDPNTLSVLLGVLTNALTSLIAVAGKEVGKQIIGKDFLQEWEQEKTALEPILRDAVFTVANEVGWEDRGEEVIALFLRSPEVEEIIRQLYSTYVLFSNNEYQESQQTLQQIFAIVFTRFIADYPANIVLTPEKTIEAANYLFEALLRSCNAVLRGATEQSILAAHEALSVFRHNVLHSEIAGIQKKLDFFIAQQSLDMPAIYDFEKRYRMQVSQRHGYIKPPNFDSARQLPIDDLYVSPNFAVASNKNQEAKKETFGLQTFLSSIYRAVLLGNPGGGKSTLTQKVCHDIAAYYSERLFAGREQLTPILVVLRNYGAEKKERRCSIREYIETEVEATYQLPPAPDGALEYLLMNGRAIAIFDGLDELLETSYRQEIRDDVQSFCNLYPAVPVLVTSDEEVQAEMDARGFSSEQQQFIWQWVRHEKNFIEWQKEEEDDSKL